MIEIVNGSSRTQILCDTYCITRKYNGADEISFDLPVDDPVCRQIAEETLVYEMSEKQTYVVRRLQSGDNSIDVEASLDLDDWRRQIHVGYTNYLTGALATVQTVLPTGWTCTQSNSTHDAEHRVVELDAPTGFDVLEAVQDEWLCAMRFDNHAKTVHVIWPEDIPDSGMRFDPSKNLRGRPKYTGKSTDICTRLYAIGKDGLTFESINDDKEYVENFAYTDKIIADVMIEDSIEDAALLKEVATKRLSVMAVPTREWQLDVVDLYRIDSSTWSNEAVDIHQGVSVYDERLDEVVPATTTGGKIYPHYPEMNEITVTTGWASDSTLRKKIGRLLNKRTQSRTGKTGSYGQYITYNYRNGKAEIFFNMDQTNVPMTAGQTMVYDLTQYFPTAYRTATVENGYGYMTTADGTMVAEAHPMISGNKIYANIVFLKTGTFSGHIYAYAKVTNIRL